MVSELVAAVLLDVEMCLQDHWVKLCIYQPVSLLEPNPSLCKFISLPISGGIGPIQSEEKISKNGDGERVHHGLI